MKNLQLLLLAAAVVSFGAAPFFIGNDMGETLWRAGMAILFVDTVSQMLWPTRVSDRI
ncbi:MAG: hypothetical protein ACYSVY_26165 [Planctomycetota bacterium]|jgi:hypothetical protein